MTSYSADPCLKLVSLGQRCTQLVTSSGLRHSELPLFPLKKALEITRRFSREPEILGALEKVMETDAARLVFQELLNLGVLFPNPPGPAAAGASLQGVLSEVPKSGTSMVSALEGPIVVYGQKSLAEPLYQSLREIRPEVSWIDGPESQVASALKKAALLLYVANTPSLRTIESLSRICRKTDTFLLPIVAVGISCVRVGPMVAPGWDHAFEHAYWDGRAPEQAVLLKSLDRRSGMKVVEGLWSSAFEAVQRVIATPTLPLLWQTLDVHPGSLKLTPLNSQGLLQSASTSKRFSIARFLHADALASAPGMAKAIQRGYLVMIQNALPPEFAAGVHRALDRSEAWKVQEQVKPSFSYRHHGIEEPKDWPAEVKTAQLIFNSEATKKWVESISGRECDGDLTMSPTWHMAGDYSLPHCGVAGTRRVAFAWTLAQRWDSRWGGDFFWGLSRRFLPPAFNALYLYNVDRRLNNQVCLVNGRAQAKRLELSGWWTSAGEVSWAPGKKPERALAKNWSVVEFIST